MKNIYRGKEFKLYDELMALQKDLRQDFFKVHPDYSNSEGIYIYTRDQYPTPESWKVYPIKYVFDDADEEVKEQQRKLDESVKHKYPTAYALTQKYGDACPTACYTVLDPHSGINRHTDIENPARKYINVHIPLDVPEGDLGLEVDGEVVRWDDLFAWDNQKIHSAWNNTDKKRLIFLMDIDRSLCDL